MAIEQFKQSVFDAIRLDNVIWVDDRFAPNSGDFKDEFLAEVKNYYEVDPTFIQEFEPFLTIGELQSSFPFDTWKDQLPEDEDSIDKFYRYIGKDLPDFTPEEFQELKNIFESNTNKRVHTLSNKKWQQEKEFWLKNSDENLFLIDYDFSRESLPKDHGKLIVFDVLSSALSNIYCVLFTSETKNGSEEECERLKIIKEIPSHIKPQYFSVLSKDIMEDDKKICIEFKASEFVKRIFLRKLSSEMVESISEKLIESINNLKSDLSQHSIYEVDSSIFMSSLDEGASEIDLLHRLFSIKQSEAISQYLNEQNSILEKIVAYRSVQTSPILRDETYVEYLKGLILPNNNFSKLRHQEVFDTTINITHAPIRSGDIFDIGEQKYILLEQACDLMVRAKPDELGERSVSEVLLVPFKTESVSNKKKPKEAHERQLNSRESCDFIVLPKDSNNNIYYTFNFGKAIFVNVNWLDLCVFNSSGLIRFYYNQELSPLVFLPGWIEKFNQLKEALKIVKSTQVKPTHYSPVTPCVLTTEPLNERIVQQYSSFTLNNAQTFDIKVHRDKLSMNGQRLSHLRETFSNKLLRSYFVGYKARIALDKDFSI
ncbi:hypothetical protein [Enterovibrio baiacu]|uniref:hypothetical protein n=1 Tax=Enterovibrio baiacu TaxID=2491023 RepID=UPI0010112EF3|nr:hypothetical protein [Enterovibrio baiacu]MBE1277412.1 hypothetical protein [Enterovibrio baiacu]